MCGEFLKQAGYTDLYGLDGSKEMLEVARGKNLYKNSWVVLVGVDELPTDCLIQGDMAVASACLIKGHFPNTCFKQMLSCVKVGGRIAFSIRDIYLDSATDNSMNFKPTLDTLTNEGLIQLETHERYTKYKGLQFGSGHQEEGANIMIYKKLKE